MSLGAVYSLGHALANVQLLDKATGQTGMQRSNDIAGGLFKQRMQECMHKCCNRSAEQFERKPQGKAHVFEVTLTNRSGVIGTKSGKGRLLKCSLFAHWVSFHFGENDMN